MLRVISLSSWDTPRHQIDWCQKLALFCTTGRTKPIELLRQHSRGVVQVVRKRSDMNLSNAGVGEVKSSTCQRRDTGYICRDNDPQESYLSPRNSRFWPQQACSLASLLIQNAPHFLHDGYPSCPGQGLVTLAHIPARPYRSPTTNWCPQTSPSLLKQTT